jgi:hypothetical protein
LYLSGECEKEYERKYAERPVLVMREQKSASFGATLKAVFWSFLGIRKKSDHDQETAKLNPLHLLIAALMAVAILIAVLLLIVKSIVPH